MEKLYSEKFDKINTNVCSADIKSALLSVQEVCINNSYKLFSFCKDYIGISFKIEVPLPSRGTVNEIDIKEIEPIFLLINSKTYPYEAPLVFSDRHDFPSDKLPHLNPVPKGSPSCFCIHRGDINEWFIEHTLKDFILRLQNWLKDAARDRLIKSNYQDKFEVTRITESIGYNVFNPKDFIEKTKKSEDINFEFLLYEVLKDYPLVDSKKSIFSIKYKYSLMGLNIKKLLDDIKQKNEIESTDDSVNKRNIGILLYPPNDYVSKEYFSSMPISYCDFESWCISLKLDIKKAINLYLSNGYQCLGGIPISIAIRRPLELINTNSTIEILNFVIHAGGDLWPVNNCINPDSMVYILENRKPVNISFARELSNQTENIFEKKAIFIGCGAVGSKLILHLAKSGLNNYDIIDSDKMSPHNLIRHGLLANCVGKNKAEALKEEIEKIYYSDKLSLNIESKDINGEVYLNSLTRKEQQDISEIIDTTASNSFQMFLSDKKLCNKIRCIRCEIAFDGRLGILKVEGEFRSPRLDDLNIYLIDLSIEDEFISSWLQNYRFKCDNGGFEFEEINVGVSCNSNTLKLSDDIISYHTSIFSYGIKRLLDDKDGHLLLSIMDNNMKTKLIKLGNVLDIKFKNDSKWRLRISEKISKNIIHDLKSNQPNETGGLLLGKIDVKRKIIYITRYTHASKDSKKSSNIFVRGINNVPEEIENCRKKSGNLIDYIGEWHTHPGGSGIPSETDYVAVNELRKELDKVPYPTFMLIVTATKLNPYIFGPKSLL